MLLIEIPKGAGKSLPAPVSSYTPSAFYRPKFDPPLFGHIADSQIHFTLGAQLLSTLVYGIDEGVRGKPRIETRQANSPDGPQAFG